MPTKVIPTDVDPVNIDRVIQAVNDNYYKYVDLLQTVRTLENRLDNLVPTTMNMTVLPASKVIWGAALIGAAVCGYLAYTEVRRANEKAQN